MAGVGLKSAPTEEIKGIEEVQDMTTLNRRKMMLGGGMAALLTKETEITGGEKRAQMRTGATRRESPAQSMLDRGSHEIVPMKRDPTQEEMKEETHHHLLTSVEDHVTENLEESRHHQEEK